MPTTANRAARWIASRKATPFWKRGIFCVRLNVAASGRTLQVIALGVDPGSKKEGYTVKSDSHTYINLNVDAITWISDAVKTRRTMRRSRRSRKTPCRACRSNRNVNDRLSPSTRALWNWKLRISLWLQRMYPITIFVVEDIVAITKPGKHKWNKSFSPLEVGKKWFYLELSKLGRVETKQGYETKALRDTHGLKKSKKKMANIFSAHCVDSWVLANWFVGGHIKPDNTRMLAVTPLHFHRRQLHRLQPEAGGKRKPYGGTLSNGFVRGSLVHHPKHGLTYIGGERDDCVSLRSIKTGKRLCQNAKPTDLKFRTFNTWRTNMLLNKNNAISDHPASLRENL